jgi:hypothetical protein
VTVFIAILLAVLTFAFIAYPLLKQRFRAAVDSGEDEKLLELQSKRDTTYSMLKELEFDFQSGILSEDDYQDLEARYKRKAISILRDIDDSEKGTNVEEEIERQVVELRRGKYRFCPQCGARCQEDARFCSGCGTSLNEGERVD